MYRIFTGIPSALSSVTGYTAMEGIDRYVMLDGLPEAGEIKAIAAHVIACVERGNQHAFGHTTAHAHDYAELNVMVGNSSTLLYRYEVDGEAFMVSSPATVYISANTPHRMEAISGTGVFLCIHLNTTSG